MTDFEWKKSGLSKKCGIIAQECQEVFPSAIHKTNDEAFGPDEEGTLGVSTTSFITILMKAVQELTAKVEALENQ